MSKLFDKDKLRLIRKGYLTAILWTLIIELIVWVLVILLSKDIYDPTIGKIQTMFLAFVACALLNVGAFKCMELGDNKSRAFAITTLITSIIAVILDLLLIWEVFPGLDTSASHFGNNNLSVMSKITLSTALTALASLIEANIMMSAKTKKFTRNAASVILTFFYVCFLVAIIGIDLTDKLSLLVTVVPFASLLIYFVATRIAKLEDVSSKKIISELADAEQAQHRKAIAEREAAAKAEAEKKKAALAAQPPLQDENMPPSATSGIKINRPNQS